MNGEENAQGRFHSGLSFQLLKLDLRQNVLAKLSADGDGFKSLGRRLAAGGFDGFDTKLDALENAVHKRCLAKVRAFERDPAVFPPNQFTTDAALAVAHHCSDSTSGQWFGRALGEVDACDVFERDWEFGEWCFKRHLALSNADHLTAHAVFIGEENEILVALLFGHIVAAGDFAVPFRKANLAQGDGLELMVVNISPLDSLGSGSF